MTKTPKSKPSTAPAPQEKKRDVLNIVAASASDLDAATARTLVRPEVGAAATIERWQPKTHDVNELVRVLDAQVQAVHQGDMRRAEAMLVAQAHTLNEVFNNLMRRAVNQQYLKQWETYMRVGMKAQNQCRMTLETLAELKNPRPVAFVRQANISNGPQQVNNGPISPPVHAGAPTPAGETDLQPNRLLETSDVERLDAGAQGASGRTHQDLATVGAVDRSDHCSR